MTATALQLQGELRPAYPLSIPQLRRWLDGSWALLFSHADDFAAYGFEADRWLAHVREAFASTRVRPLARTCETCGHSAGWVTDVGGWWATDQHFDEIRRTFLRERTTDDSNSDWVWNSRQRFVLLLDDALHVRRCLLYRPAALLPSPIQLAAMAELMRLGRMSRRRSTSLDLGSRRLRPCRGPGSR